ncbi:hypothetical protein [Mesorhizobium sp. WSM3866]|nr:hypothetical protein [Mesorhizobium sp. WSM3866]
MNRLRYYKPTVGSDYIPDRFAWVDRVAASAITFAATAILGATLLHWWFQ